MVLSMWKRVGLVVTLLMLQAEPVLAVEPLHLIREPEMSPPESQAWAAATAADPTLGSARDPDWLQVMGRWLRAKRGASWSVGVPFSIAPSSGQGSTVGGSDKRHGLQPKSPLVVKRCGRRCP